MTVVGLRELRQQASEIIRRVEAGEEVTVTVAGRPRVRMVPVQDRRWRTYGEIAALFDGPADPDFAADRELLDQALDDPWERG